MTSSLKPEEAVRLRQAMEDQWNRPYVAQPLKKSRWAQVDWHGNVIKPSWLLGKDNQIDIRIKR